MKLLFSPIMILFCISCSTKPEYEGCMDTDACNYMPFATIDDDCDYYWEWDQEACDCDGNIFDCLGECDGDAWIDECGVCDGGNAHMDECGVCFGGNTDMDECGL